MFAYYLNINNYKTKNILKKEFYEEDIELEALGEMKFPYEDVPELTLSQVKELKARRISCDPNVPRLTELEQASVERYYFDQGLQEDLQDDRRACIWTLYYKLGKQKY